MIVTAIFLLVLIGGMVIGMPIAHALVLTGVALMWHLDFFDTQLLAQNLQAGFDNFPLLAVPFFILAGELMNAGGLSRRIIDLARAFVGHIRGGLGFVVIGAAVLLASMSGSAIADTAALATILLPMMREQKYPMSYSAGLLASGGIIAPIIPPSMPFVIYGVTTNTSISKLFLSGVAPGLMMGFFLIGAWWWIARRHGLPAMERVAWGPRMKTLAKSFWAMMMPVIILGGLRGGIFTPTEAAVVAAVYALLVSMFVYRELNWQQLYGVFLAAGKTTAVVMFLCGAATVTAYMITLADLPNMLADSFSGVMGSPVLFMALMMVFLLVVGTAMDLTPTILIFGPVCAPLAVRAGIDPVYFGFMFIYVGCIGLITPPVGTVQNVVAGVGRLRMETVIKGTTPFLAVYVLLLVLFTLFPALITAPLRWMH
ncbi:TRAP transporter large permease subunit [Alicycliphilus denitrificans]|uniref:TRAP transporter large permease protein n=2 Tax=Alicycliphilus denitrificans TaxID=179636 RepID=F4G5V2_ALIDK|nr:TRAP transporter large permease subunit [Alicycliphilus denitrificans]ADV00388.1 TRAP dicarboxylate transporter, DctM subunit [Alicycliphilus denitrificans BC]AEB85359.1 TRAP dicarboxylate transporter, DctM subunit [Alicycliphilus denitrificans K601]QKD43831.1 TRAP transporter large permease subunit [Alicycliphilus denitrificans]GAO22878.1 TRAP dicarboxylate transporter subunit DctM [Alicycliphilus sp. B1]